MSYIDNARVFLREIGKDLDNIFGKGSVYYYRRVVEDYNLTHNTYYSVANGAVRAVIIGEDFVIKTDYSKCCAEKFGGCFDEYKMYKFAEANGYAHLLAKVTKIKGGHHYYYVMPRMDYLGEDVEEELNDYFREDEMDWINDDITDLHDANYGFLDGEAYIIDYACSRNKIS